MPALTTTFALLQNAAMGGIGPKACVIIVLAVVVLRNLAILQISHGSLLLLLRSDGCVSELPSKRKLQNQVRGVAQEDFRLTNTQKSKLMANRDQSF